MDLLSRSGNVVASHQKKKQKLTKSDFIKLQVALFDWHRTTKFLLITNTY